MSAVVTAALQSNNASPPVIKNTSGTEVGQFCRAWVNFNGTGTVAIRAAFNVSSITDNATGDYSINFINAMPDADYVTMASAGGATTDSIASTSTAPSTSSTRVYTVSAGVVADNLRVGVAIFR